VSNDNTEGRVVSVSDLAYDSRQDQVVLALNDCFYEEGGPGANYTWDYSDCHYELRTYWRTSSGSSSFTTLELPEEIQALDYDADNDLLMVSGQTRVLFLASTEDTGAPVPDAGLIAREPAYQFPLTGTFQYCD
jgi:hypothetical protein